MPMKNKTRPIYTDFELKHELTDVFKSVWFADVHEKDFLRDSYFLNFDDFIGYARDNHIDEKKYIRSLRDILLTYPGATQTWMQR